MVIQRIGPVIALVDEVKTARLYKNTRYSKCRDSADANFLANIHLRQMVLDEYFKPLGIDAAKCSDLWVKSVDPYRQCVFYAGRYSFVGEIQDKETLGNLEDSNSKWFDVERTDFGFELSYNVENDLVQPAITFEVELPWLYEPPIQVQGYINRTKLPQSWSSITCVAAEI